MSPDAALVPETLATPSTKPDVRQPAPGRATPQRGSSSLTLVTSQAGLPGGQPRSSEPWNYPTRADPTTVNPRRWYGTGAGPGVMLLTLPDLLPRLGGQMQDPEVPVVVELLSIGRGKLPAKDPQLSAALGHHHSLLRERRQVRAQPYSSQVKPEPLPQTTRCQALTSSSNACPIRSFSRPAPLWFC